MQTNSTADDIMGEEKASAIVMPSLSSSACHANGNMQTPLHAHINKIDSSNAIDFYSHIADDELRE